MFGWKRKQKRLEKLFGQYVSPELVDRVSSDKLGLDLNVLNEGHIEFALIAVRGSSPSTVGVNMGRVVEIAHSSGWLVECLVSGVVVLLNGALPLNNDSASGRVTLINELQSTLADDVKAIHGATDAQYGNLGSPQRMTHGAVLPNFLEDLAILAELPYGEAVEQNAS